MTDRLRKVRVELGRRWIAAKDVWRVEPGTVLDLGQGRHDRVDVYVDGKLVARGEAVVVDGKLGVRVREIVSPE